MFFITLLRGWSKEFNFIRNLLHSRPRISRQRWRKSSHLFRQGHTKMVISIFYFSCSC